jgi:hypothetical protein
MQRWVVFVLFIIILTTAPFAAQATPTAPDVEARLNYLGFKAEAAIVVDHAGDYHGGWISHGGSLGLHYGRRLHRHLAFELHGGYAAFDGSWGNPYAEVTMIHAAHLTMSFKVPLVVRKTLVPYLRGGFGLEFMLGEFGDDCERPSYSQCGGGGFINLGPVMHVAGGLEWYLSRSMSIGAEVGYRATALLVNSEGSERIYHGSTVVHALTVGLTAAVHL